MVENEKNFFIITCYCPPDDTYDQRIQECIRVLNYIQEKYMNSQIIVYGDFNTPREDMLNIVRRLGSDRWILHYDQSPTAYTRYSQRRDDDHTSYLDYFLTYGILLGYQFDILPKQGYSDHLPLRLRIVSSQVGTKFKYNSRTIFSTKQVQKDADDITKLLLEDGILTLDKYYKVTALNNFKYRAKEVRYRSAIPCNEKITKILYSYDSAKTSKML